METEWKFMWQFLMSYQIEFLTLFEFIYAPMWPVIFTFLWSKIRAKIYFPGNNTYNKVYLFFFFLSFPFGLATAPGLVRRWRLCSSLYSSGRGIACYPMWFLWARRPSFVPCRVYIPGGCGLRYGNFVHTDIVEMLPYFVSPYGHWVSCGLITVKNRLTFLIDWGGGSIRYGLFV